MWEINSNSQILSFVYSLALGALFSTLYDIFRAGRIVFFKKNLFVFLEDIFYFFILSIITFLFLLGTTNGEVRAYILLGILLGFICFYRTVSSLTLKSFTLILRWIKSFLKAVSKSFYAFFDKFELLASLFFKNTIKIFKKGLKTTKGLLYTNRK